MVLVVAFPTARFIFIYYNYYCTLPAYVVFNFNNISSGILLPCGVRYFHFLQRNNNNIFSNVVDPIFTTQFPRALRFEHGNNICLKITYNISVLITTLYA
jgi:hypothetical protein